MPAARSHAHAAAAPAVSVQFPTVLVVVFAVIATAAQIVQQVVLSSNPQWQGIIAVLLVVLAGIGVAPLHGGAGIRTWLHVPALVALVIGAVVAALAGALQVVHMTVGAHTAIAAVLTFLAALGFGGSGQGVVVASRV